MRGWLARTRFASVRYGKPAALYIQKCARRRLGRVEVERMRAHRELVLLPAAQRLQRWFRVVVGEWTLRKLRSVVDRYTASHHAFVKEMLVILRAEDGVGEAGGVREGSLKAPNGASARLKRFEMWVTLRVGLPEGEVSPPAFQGSQVYSARTSALKRAGRYFGAFFGDPSKVEEGRDEEGHYLVHRSWKHFDAILDYIRDGSCSLPTAYVPSTYDNRPASREDEELLEFVREVRLHVEDGGPCEIVYLEILECVVGYLHVFYLSCVHTYMVYRAR